ncbi:hypothetical protein [Nostoc sp.]
MRPSLTRRYALAEASRREGGSLRQAEASTLKKIHFDNTTVKP